MPMLGEQLHERGRRDADRCRQRSVDALDEVLRARVVRLVDDHELVAADSGDGVGTANDRQQSSSGLAQHDVAGVVAVACR